MARSLLPCVSVSLLHTKKLHSAVGDTCMNRLDDAQNKLSQAMSVAEEIRSQIMAANERVHECIREGHGDELLDQCRGEVNYLLGRLETQDKYVLIHSAAKQRLLNELDI